MKLGNAWMAATICACAATVHAHAGPQVRGIYPGQTLNMLLSNRGLLFSEPGSEKWSLLCNEALGVSTAELPKIVVLPDARILAASSRGVMQTTDGGCHWEAVAPFEKIHSPSLTQDPNDTQRVYLSTFAPGMSAVHVSRDAGLTWRELVAAADSDYLGDLLVAPNQPDQLYLSALTIGRESFSYATWHSRDGGKSWEQSPITLAETESNLKLLGVSPSDPELLVAKAEAGMPTDPERLLVSHDAGKTFESPVALHVINAVVFSDDGATLSVGSDDGLFVSSDAGKTFEQVGDAAYVDALYLDRGRLMVGGYFHGIGAGVHGVGISSDGGETLSPWMLLTDVVQPLVCDATAMSAITCKNLWLDWEREILAGRDAPSAAGAGGADSGAASVSPSSGAALGGSGTRTANPAAPVSKPDSGCSVYAPVAGSRCSVLGSVIACAWLLMRRRWQRGRGRE